MGTYTSVLSRICALPFVVSTSRDSGWLASVARYREMLLSYRYLGNKAHHVPGRIMTRARHTKRALRAG